MIENGEIKDGKTLIALLWYKAEKARREEKSVGEDITVREDIIAREEKSVGEDIAVREEKKI